MCSEAVGGTYDVLNGSFAVLQVPTRAHEEMHGFGPQRCPGWSHLDPDLTSVGLARQMELVFLVFGMRADFFCLFCRQSPLFARKSTSQTCVAVAVEPAAAQVATIAVHVSKRRAVCAVRYGGRRQAWCHMLT